MRVKISHSLFNSTRLKHKRGHYVKDKPLIHSRVGYSCWRWWEATESWPFKVGLAYIKSCADPTTGVI